MTIDKKADYDNVGGLEKDPSQSGRFITEEELLASYSARHAAEVPSFVGKNPAGAVIELERILDNLFETPTPAMRNMMQSLPPKKYKGLYKLHKSLQKAPGGAFKWASDEEIEKEALFGIGEKQDSLTMLDRVLKKFEQKSGESFIDLPNTVKRKFDSLGIEVDKQIARRPQQPKSESKIPGLVEKGLDVGKAVGDKGLEVGRAVGDKAKEISRAVGDKAKSLAEAPGKLYGDVKQRYDQFQQERATRKQEIKQRQDQAEQALGKYLRQKTPFTKIYTSLPLEIRNALDKLNLVGVSSDTMNNPEQEALPGTGEPLNTGSLGQRAKLASNVVQKFLEDKKNSQES